MTTKEYREYLECDDLHDDIELLEETIEDLCPEQEEDDWIIE